MDVCGFKVTHSPEFLTHSAIHVKLSFTTQKQIFKELEPFLRLGNNSPQIVKPARKF